MAHLFHRLGHLAADAIDRHLRVPERLDGLQGQPHGIGIEGAAKGGIRGKSDDGDLLGDFGLRFRGGALRSICPYWVAKRRGGEYHPGTTSLPGQMSQHFLQFPFIRAHAFDGLLGLAEFGGGDELHRGSDLQRALDGGDAAFDFLQGWHGGQDYIPATIAAASVRMISPISSVILPEASGMRTSSLWAARIRSRKSSWNSRTRVIGMSRIRAFVPQ